MEKSLGNQAVKGVIWSAVERFSVQGIQFILSIIIARLIMPAEYGLIAMLGIFLAIAQCFVDSGFSNALIQKKDRSEIDFSTVFYFNLIVSILIYACLYVSAPYIASFYKEPLLILITRWIGLNIILSSFSIVQRAKLAIQLDFKTQAKASLISALLSGLISIILAYHGLGVWVLVIQALLGNFLNILLLWMFTGWVPLWVFSWKSFHNLFSFGSKLLLSGLLHTIYLNLYSLVIGKKYSAIDVGYYNRAYSLAQFPSINIMNIINRVIYPLLCESQEDTKKLQSLFTHYLRISCFIIFPLMIGFAVLSKPLILFLLTEKWVNVAELLSILSLAYIWYPIIVVNGSILNIKGRSDYVLKAEIIKKIASFTILLCTIPLGLKILCWGIFIYNLCDCIIIIYYAKKVIKTGYYSQIKELLSLILLSIGMGISIKGVFYLTNNPTLILIAGFIIGIFIYMGVAKIFRIKEFDFVFSLISNVRIQIH